MDGGNHYSIIPVRDLQLDIRTPEKETKSVWKERKKMTAVSGLVPTRAELKRNKVRLEVTEPNREDDSWTAKGTATVTDKDGNPVSDVEVQFSLDRVKMGEPTPTEDDGTATMEFPDLKKGNREFGVIIVGSSTKAKVVKVIKEGKPKKCAEVRVAHVEKDGRHVVSIQLLTEEGGGVKDAVVRLMSKCFEDGFVDLEKSDKNGTVKTTISFSGRSTTVTALVLGTKVETDFDLYQEVP